MWGRRGRCPPWRSVGRQPPRKPGRQPCPLRAEQDWGEPWGGYSLPGLRAFVFERGWFPGREVLLAPGPSASSFPSAGARELISGWGKAASLRSCSAAESSLLGPFHCVVSPAEEAHSLGESAYFRERWPARAALTPLPRSPDTFISSETGILVSIASGS